MGTEDKARNAADQAAGAVKEGAGKVTGDARLEAEGKAQKVRGDLGNAAEKVKDALDG